MELFCVTSETETNTYRLNNFSWFIKIIKNLFQHSPYVLKLFLRIMFNLNAPTLVIERNKKCCTVTQAALRVPLTEKRSSEQSFQGSPHCKLV